MIRYIPFIFILITSHIFPVHAAFELTPLGARPAGLAGAFVALSDDANSPFTNPAGMSLARRVELTSLYTRLYGLDDLTHTMASAVSPLPIGAIGLAYTGLGGDLYRENVIGVSYSRAIMQRFMLGVTVRSLMLTIQNYGHSRETVLDFGGMILLPGHMRLGVMRKDITGTDLSGRKDHIPRTLQIGISRTGSMVTLSAQIDHDPGHPATGRIGQEFYVSSHVTIRTGIVTQPSAFFAGFGVTLPLIKTDYALSSHATLGLTHRISLSLHFGGPGR